MSLLKFLGLRQIRKKYNVKTFVETGTLAGDGIQAALDAGFEKVYSIEISGAWVLRAQARFADKPNVKIINGDTIDELPKLCKEIEEPVLFWLDAHFAHIHDKTQREIPPFPLLREVQIIKDNRDDQDVLLLDDIVLLAGCPGISFIPADIYAPFSYQTLLRQFEGRRVALIEEQQGILLVEPKSEA
jgi:hypothetical protein